MTGPVDDSVLRNLRARAERLLHRVPEPTLLNRLLTTLHDAIYYAGLPLLPAHTSEPTTDVSGGRQSRCTLHSTITSTWSCAPCSSISPSNAISCTSATPPQHTPRDEAPPRGTQVSTSQPALRRQPGQCSAVRSGGGKERVMVTHLALLRRAQRAHKRLEHIRAPLVGKQHSKLHLEERQCSAVSVA